MVLDWMLEEARTSGEKNLASRTVARFPEHFRGNKNANLTKASRWWKGRGDFLNSMISKESLSLSRCQRGIRRKLLRKASQGRGRKRAPWVSWLHEKLIDEFTRLRKAGLKFSPSMLRLLARRILIDSEESFSAKYLDERNGRVIIEKITFRCIQSFMERCGIVSRAQTGKLMVSKEKMEYIEREVAYHLGRLSREFTDGTLDEGLVENIDETHFIINMDNGRTLGFAGDNNVKYADVVSGGEGMTMVVRITGGPYARIEPPMIIFCNSKRSYPIKGVADNVPGVSYRTQPKGWMDREVFVQWLQNERAIRADPLGRKRVIFLDNCGGHNETIQAQRALQKLNATIRFLPPNSTDLCQPAYSFIISKIKDEWTHLWDEKKIDLIEAGAWQKNSKSPSGSSGKLKNPGKRFFLTLAATAVRRVNAMRDDHGITYARKAMIRCGLSKDLNGQWHEKQLFPHLQEIVKKYRSNFEGEEVDMS